MTGNGAEQMRAEADFKARTLTFQKCNGRAVPEWRMGGPALSKGFVSVWAQARIDPAS